MSKHSLNLKISCVCRWLLVPYFSVILWLTFFNREPTSHRFELTPFWEYRYLFNGTLYEKRYYLQQIRGNILLFVPWGFMLPTIFKRYHALKSIVLVGLSFSICIELLQLITARGLCEFDDVFNNTLGVIIGYGIYKLTYTIISRIEK